jgi:hypothetical protein
VLLSLLEILVSEWVSEREERIENWELWWEREREREKNFVVFL